MTNMAKFFLIVFLVLFAIMHLVVTKIPDWVLGLAAALAALGLIVDTLGWKRASQIMLLALPLGMTGCMGVGTITNAAKELKNQTIIINANTPWGPQRYIGLNTNTTVIVSTDGTLTINPHQIQLQDSVIVSPVMPELRVRKGPTGKPIQ